MQKYKDFWYQFDNETLFQRSDRFNSALMQAYFRFGKDLDWPADALRQSFQVDNHPGNFVAEMSGAKEGLIELGNAQEEILNQHLNGAQEVQEAFELFGQGILFDDRPPRPPSRYIHMMDGDPENWVGWQRWYGFVRSVVLLAPEKNDTYLNWARSIALAWAIQTEARPALDNPNNPGVPEGRLAILRDKWLNLTWENLDWAFATHQYLAPNVDEFDVDPESLELNYSGVKERLEAATGPSARPNHAGAGRFWLKPYSEFVTLPIYGHKLIAPPGPDRGANSALVKVLRGTLQGMPIMPLNRPPMSSDDIDYIERWIDSGLPR